MQIELQAAVAKLTAKPPKFKDGVEIQGPVMQIVLEVEGTGQIGQVAQFLGQDCLVKVQSYQMHFDELRGEASRETHLAQTR